MLGVNLEEAWNQGSLIGPPPSMTGKSSKCTVPINQTNNYNNNNTQMVSPAQRYGTPSFQPPMLEHFGNSDRPDMMDNQNQGHQAYLKADGMDIPISNPAITGHIHGNQNSSYSPQPSPPSPELLEIPRLKEQLTQQSNYMMDCQKEVLFMKNLIHQLKKELHDARQQHEKNKRKKRWMKVMWMVLLMIMVMVILAVVVQIIQKINVMMNQTMLY
jgi:hypothetical protein